MGWEGREQCHEFGGTLYDSMNHNTSPTKPNKTAKTMPNTRFIPPSTALIPDEVPLLPVVEEPVDVDLAPVAVPEVEVDPLVLEVKKVAFGSIAMVTQVPPIKKGKC